MSVIILRKNSALFFLFLYAMVCNAQSKVTGVVLDQNSNPIPEASIQVLEHQDRGTVSDFDGNFSLEIPPGSYTLKASFVGFKNYIKKIVVDNSTTASLTIVSTRRY